MSERRTDFETLARRLDQVLPPGSKLIPPLTPDPLVNTAAQLAIIPALVLSGEASRRIETRMLAAFDAQQPRLLPRSVRPSTAIWRWALVASLVLVVLWIGLTPAVAASLPGEPLYSVKLFYEKIEFAAATTPAAKANVYLQHADRRTQEALTLLDRNQFDPSLVNQALSNLAAASTEADAWQSARLRGQLSQIEIGLEFVLRDASQGELISPVELAPLKQQLRQLEDNPPLPSSIGPGSAPSAPEAGDEPTATPTPTPTETPRAPAGLPTCDPHGYACLSEGIPGGGVPGSSGDQPTRRPTNTPRPTNTRRPSNTPIPTNTRRPSNTPIPTNTRRPTNTPHPTNTPRADPGGGNPGGGSGNGNGNSGGNGNGNSGSNGNGNGNGGKP